jgi:hypothetical protein
MSAQATPYRNADDEVARHAMRLLASHRQVDDKKLAALYRNRCARAGFGYFGTVAGVLALVAITVADSGQVHMLAFAWAVACCGAVVAYHWASHDLTRRAKRAAIEPADPYSLVIQLTNTEGAHVPDNYMLERIESLGLDSHRYPLVVGALLLPLSLIAGFFALSDGMWTELEVLTKFAFVYTAHVHIFAVIAAWRFPKGRKAARTISIAAGLGLLPFIISSLFVGVIAAVITVCLFLPLSRWVDNENFWIAQEKQERATAAKKQLEEPLLAGTALQVDAIATPKSTVAVANPL